MAKRLKTRLSAGAALVTGIGMMGLATAVPAQAATVTLDYTCTYSVLNIGEVAGDPAVSVELTADIPTTAKVGDEVSSAVAATVTIPDARRDSLYGLLGIRQVDGPNAADAAAEDGGLNTNGARNQAHFTLSDGTNSAEGIIPLEVPMTDVPASGELVVEATGAIAPISVDGPGTYTATATDFQAYIRGYGENGDYKTNITMNCTVADGQDATVATVEVTEATDPEPTDPDPSSPEPTDPGTDDPGTDDPGTDDPGTDDPGTDEPGTDEPSATVGDGTDDGSTDPETPGVVQTDDATVLSGDNNAALLLGGVLLAGAGAGAVTIARRRSSSQH